MLARLHFLPLPVGPVLSDTEESVSDVLEMCDCFVLPGVQSPWQMALVSFGDGLGNHCRVYVQVRLPGAWPPLPPAGSRSEKWLVSGN